MCGLYSLRKSAEETRSLFGYEDRPDFPPRAHVAPGQPIAIVRTEQQQRRFALVRWGFIPSWVKEVRPGKPLINARGETVMVKPSFRNAMRRRRCLIPADGFYEWLGDMPGRKIPYHVQRADGGLFAFGGLWEHWMGADGSEIETALILTTTANREISEIRGRMPVVIARDGFGTWLNGEAEDAAKLIRPPADETFVLETAELSRSARSKSKSSAPPGQMKLL